MDVKTFISDNGFSDFPVGLGGCKLENNFESCIYDVVVFDEKKGSEIIEFKNEFVKTTHASLSETNSKKLLSYEKLEIIHDESWELRMFLSKIVEKRSSLYSNFAKNSLIESLFCCQKTIESIENSNVFAPCWQKCASFYLVDPIMALNCKTTHPSHILDALRKFEMNLINEHISITTQTVGIERATPTLLERMLKSTIGFSDKLEQNNHSKIISQKYDYFIQNSMLADCYFYLGYTNKENFISIKDSLNREEDLIHILKVAFDIESDSNMLSQQANLIEKSCKDILEIVSRS